MDFKINLREIIRFLALGVEVRILMLRSVHEKYERHEKNINRRLFAGRVSADIYYPFDKSCLFRALPVRPSRLIAW